MGVVSFASCLVLTAAALLKAKEGSQAGVLVRVRLLLLVGVGYRVRGGGCGFACAHVQ